MGLGVAAAAAPGWVAGVGDRRADAAMAGAAEMARVAWAVEMEV